MNTHIRLFCLMLTFFCSWFFATDSTADNVFQDRLKVIYDLYKRDPAASCGQLEGVLQSADAAVLENQQAKEAYYFLANCLYQQKDYDKAVGAYLKTAEIDTQDSQPLVDAGSVLVQQGQYAKAKDQYQKALQRALGDMEQEAKIRSAMRNIPGHLQKDFTLSTGIGYDSNVNSGPEDSIHVIYGGFNYVLDSAGKARDDFYSYNSAGATFGKMIDSKSDVFFKTAATHTAYFEEDNFDTSTLSASTGYKRTFNGKSITYSPFVHYQTLDGQSYQINSGLNISGAGRLSKKINIWPHVGAYNQTFYRDSLRDALGLSVGGSASYALNDKTSWITSLFYSRNNAKDGRFSYKSAFAGNSLNRTFSENLSVSLGYNFQLFDYDSVDPAFSTAREDNGHMIYLNLSYSLKRFIHKYTAFLVFNISRDRNNSNQSFYDNHRTFSSLKITFSF